MVENHRWTYHPGHNRQKWMTSQITKRMQPGDTAFGLVGKQMDLHRLCSVGRARGLYTHKGSVEVKLCRLVN